MVVSSSTRLLNSLSQRSVPVWLTPPKAHFHPIPQGVLSWQTTVEELLASVRHCSRQTTATATKLWMGQGTDQIANGLCRDSWYGVGLVKAVARSISGNALINPHRALPGTILDIKTNGITIAVVNGAVRLSQFLTPLGRPLLATQLPLSIGQRLPRLTSYQQRSIAQFEDGIVTYESAWHQRLTQLKPLQLPVDAAEPGLGSIFARLPLNLEPALAQSSPVFQDYLAQHGASVLITVLMSYLMQLNNARLSNTNSSGDRAHSIGGSDIGLRNIHLQQQLRSEELTALFAGHVPARFALNLQESFAHNLKQVLKELQFLETALTHRQDLALGVNEIKQPSLYPVLMEVVTDISEAPHRLGQALTIQVTESGTVCAWFYNPAVLGEEEVAQMQAAFVSGLQMAARAPEMPIASHWSEEAKPVFSSRA